MTPQTLIAVGMWTLVLCGAAAFARGPHRGTGEEHRASAEAKQSVLRHEAVGIGITAAHSMEQAKMGQGEARAEQATAEAQHAQASAQIINQTVELANSQVQSVLRTTNQEIDSSARTLSEMASPLENLKD